jgi:hypothetical protein
VEARVFPKGVQRGWHAWARGPETSEWCDVRSQTQTVIRGGRLD